MERGANIYNYIDEERKIMGFSIVEISVTGNVDLTVSG